VTQDLLLPEIRREDQPADFAIRLRLQVFPSQRAAARYFGRTPGTISRYESEALTPPLGYLAGLMIYLLDQHTRAGAAPALLQTEQQFLLAQLQKLMRWFAEPYKHQDPFRAWSQVERAAAAYHDPSAVSAATSTSAPPVSEVPSIVAPPDSVILPAPTPTELGERRVQPVIPFRLPYPRNALFVGRSDLLADLNVHLAAGEVVVVTGTGGVGKTQAVVEYAYQSRAHYPGGVFWLNMEQPESIANQVALCGGPDGLALPHWDPQHFTYNLAAVQAAWILPVARLLILDNLEDPALLTQWRPRIGGCRVLVTTRRSTWLARSGVTTLALAPLPRTLSLTLLLLPRAHQQDAAVADLLMEGAVTASADAICELLGDLPLALALAGSYLESYNTVPLVRYQAQLAAESVAHASLNTAQDEALPTGHLSSVEATFALSYHRLDPARSDDGSARVLLHRIAQLAPTVLPQRLLVRVLGGSPDDPAAVETLVPAVQRLLALGLLESLPVGAVRLHRLLAAFIRARVTYAPDDAGAAAAAVLAEVTAVNRAGALLSGQPYLDHLWYLLEHTVALPDRTVGSLVVQLGDLLYGLGDLARGRICYEQALAHYTRVAGAADPLSLHSRLRLARLARHQGDFAAAHPLLETAVQLSEATLGSQHILTAASLNQLAGLLRELGDLPQARVFVERALAIRETMCGPFHPDTADSLMNLGHVLLRQGNMTAAQSLFERSLHIREQALGAVHPDTATSWHNVGLVYHAQGNLAVAQVLYERALTIYEQTLGARHPDTARALSNLARLWQDGGDQDRAQIYYARSLAMYEQAVGLQHPLTAQVRAAQAQLAASR